MTVGIDIDRRRGQVSDDDSNNPTLPSRWCLVSGRRPRAGQHGARPATPREHGAWGMLLIPYGTAVGVAATWSWALGLLLVSTLAFYIARTSYLKRDWRWTIALLAVSGACGLPLLWIWHRWWLAVFVAVAAWLAFRPTKRSLIGELVAVGGLTLTAPAAWYVARGELDAMALRLWVLNTLFFASGVFYVKMHVAAAVARDPLAAVVDRLRRGRMNLVFHGLLLVVLTIAVVTDWIPPAVILAFVPVLARAVAGTARLSPVLRIKRLGWTEVIYSVVYAVVLVLSLRPGDVNDW